MILLASKIFEELTIEERQEFMDRILAASRWLQIMGNWESVSTPEGNKECPTWQMPYSPYFILLYGDWTPGGKCRFIATNGESGSAVAISWIFLDDWNILVVNVPDDLTSMENVLDCLDVVCSKRYQELEGVCEVVGGKYES